MKTGFIFRAKILATHFLCTLISMASSAQAEHFKFRARENYEIIRFSGLTQNYSGLSSSINFYYEKPYKLSYGLIVNPGLGLLKNGGDSHPSIGNKLRLFEVGTDIKYFPNSDYKLFFRNTLVFQYVRTDSAISNTRGYGASISFGWEFWLYDLFSLAPEFGYKHSRLESSLTSNAIIFSLGVHFY